MDYLFAIFICILLLLVLMFLFFIFLIYINLLRREKQVKEFTEMTLNSIISESIRTSGNQTGTNQNKSNLINKGPLNVSSDEDEEFVSANSDLNNEPKSELQKNSLQILLECKKILDTPLLRYQDLPDNKKLKYEMQLSFIKKKNVTFNNENYILCYTNVTNETKDFNDATPVHIDIHGSYFDN